MDCQIPNRITRVKYLLDAALCNGVPLHATEAMAQNEQGLDGMIGNFETISSCSLPYDPVAKRKSAGDEWNHAGMP